MKTEHPMPLAAEVAHMIAADPIMARQIKETVSAERLLEYLEITGPVLQDVSDADLLEEISTRWSRAELLKLLD